MNDLISVVIRTMPGRETFLERCLFILDGQAHRRIEVLVVAQLLDDTDQAAGIRAVINRWGARFEALRVLSHVSSTDARAKSLNIGKRNATGRYLAFLDDDDKVYPNHYATLIKALQRTDYAWAYADVVRALYDESGRLISRSAPFRRDAYSYLDHMRGNFIPIHSFVIDLERAHGTGDVDEQLSRNEDYEYLLRLAFKYEPLYIPKFGAEYCIRNDGSNTVSDGTGQARNAFQKRRLWNAAQDALDSRKEARFGWWVRELHALPMIHPSHAQPIRGNAPPVLDYRHEPSGVYRALLLDYYRSRSWKITRPIRNLVRRLRGQPPEQPLSAASERDAQIEIERILSSSSWELTAPLRLARRILSRAWRH